MVRGPVLFALVAVAAATTAVSSNGAVSHRHSVAQVRNAFLSQDVSLRTQAGPRSADYARLASYGSLRVIVFRRGIGTGETIEVIVGREPPRDRNCRHCVVVHYGAPRGSGHAHVQQTELGNVDVVYLRSDRRAASFARALSALGRS